MSKINFLDGFIVKEEWEQVGFKALIKTSINYENNSLMVDWDAGLKAIGELDTVFETNNGVEDNDVRYVQYDAVSFQVNKIIDRHPNKENNIYNWLLQEKGSLIEITLYEDPPSRIYLTNGQNVWNKDS